MFWKALLFSTLKMFLIDPRVMGYLPFSRQIANAAEQGHIPASKRVFT